MHTKKEVILINVFGSDKPGLTSSLTSILSHYKVNILDIGQAVIHNELNLGMLIELPVEAESAPVLKDLLFKSYELGIQIKFTPISETDYNSWVDLQGKERYIISVIARKISAVHIAKVSEVIHKQKLNIDIITRLSGRTALGREKDKRTACIEFSVRGKPRDKNDMKKQFMEISRQIGVDIAFQNDNIYRRNRRLVCFDMDSTLIQTEVIDELAMRAGVGDQVQKITETAMRGEIDFKSSFIKRVALLKGMNEEVLNDVARKLPLTEGAEKLFTSLKKFGFKTAIISGGFTYFGEYLKKKLHVDYIYANELEIKDHKLTGQNLGEIIDGSRKAEILKKIAAQEHFDLEQVIAVGDGANDLPMLNIAGLGIAFHAKPVVKENADQAISTIGLDAILYLMGYRDRELS